VRPYFPPNAASEETAIGQWGGVISVGGISMFAATLRSINGTQFLDDSMASIQRLMSDTAIVFHVNTLGCDESQSQIGCFNFSGFETVVPQRTHKLVGGPCISSKGFCAGKCGGEVLGEDGTCTDVDPFYGSGDGRGIFETISSLGVMVPIFYGVRELQGKKTSVDYANQNPAWKNAVDLCFLAENTTGVTCSATSVTHPAIATTAPPGMHGVPPPPVGDARPTLNEIEPLNQAQEREPLDSMETTLSKGLLHETTLPARAVGAYLPIQAADGPMFFETQRKNERAIAPNALMAES
jgi:hypothetical protein